MTRAARSAAAVLIAILLVPRSATAQGDSVDEPKVVPAVEEPKVASVPEPASALASVLVPKPGYEKLVVTLDGLGFLTDRYGATLEVVLSPRNTLTAYPWYLANASSGTPDLSLSIWGGSSYRHYDAQTRAVGLDLQYRRFFGPFDGARGLFVAPGVEGNHFVARSVGYAVTYGQSDSDRIETPLGQQRQAWTYLAASLDIGAQAILPLGLTFGGSLGAHYRVIAEGDLDDGVMPWTWGVSHGPGLRPRLRLWLGWAFL